MGDVVKIKSFYDLTENSIMKQILLDHYQIIMKHYGNIEKFDIEGFNIDIKFFYTKWHGNKSSFVRKLSIAAISSAYTFMAEGAQMGIIDLDSEKPHIEYTNISFWKDEVSTINRYYNTYWQGMKNFLNGRHEGNEWVMDDTYFDNVELFTKQISGIDFRYLKQLKNSMTVSLIGEIEDIYKCNQ